ncbi:MAG: ribose-5-phosphate isomerase RpiA [Candidatus Diapherotrites archaeon]|nr:ribose-5-phosphate isomerase RpiA [Candidatus Diapherotrites archaeon]
MEELKKRAAERACKYIKDGMIVGMGTGSTVKHAIDILSKRKLRVVVIPTSVETEDRCREAGMELGSINELIPDIAIDGADEVDPEKNLTKGGGGALTREKIIDYRAKKFVVIVDESKLVKHLGEKHPLPVEVLPFAYERVRKELAEIFEKVEKRDFVTDQGNYILDCYGKITNPHEMELMLNNIPGVVENGLFTRNVWKVVVGAKKGVKTF